MSIFYFFVFTQKNNCVHFLEDKSQNLGNKTQISAQDGNQYIRMEGL